MQEKNNLVEENDVILGKGISSGRRALAFFSILIIYFFYNYNFTLGTFVKPTMIADVANGGFGFTLKQSEEIFAVMSFGTIPGTFLFGWLGSRIGKKNALIIVALGIAVTTFMPLLNPTSLLLWKTARLLCGVILGGAFGCAQPLVADLFPSKYRGKLAATLTSMFSLAMVFGGWVYGMLGDANWKTLMFTAIIPPVVGAIMTLFFVPSDYEYCQQVRAESKETGEKINYLSMYRGKYLWIGLGVILLSGANFSGYSAFGNNATTYLVGGLGVSAAAAGSIYSVQGVGTLIGYNFWGFMSDKKGRRVPLIGMFLSAVFIFIYTRLSANSMTAFYVVSFFIGICTGFSGAWGAYYSELFPSKFRALSAGISFNGGRIISTFAIPAIAGLATSGADMMIIFYVAMAIFVAGSVVWFLLPETLNKEED